MLGRFAPSPTGALHLGGARTALVAWLQARAAGGAFVLRVEDLDRPRVVPNAEREILEDLRWLGIDWDEGPDVGGPFAPYRQSDRTELFNAAVEKLLVSHQSFPCFCSRADLARAATAPHGPSDDGPRYPGTCRELTAQEIAARSAERPPSIRLRVADEQVRWTDLIHGPRADTPSQTVGDFVLRRADGVPAYQLAVVVDDAAMQLTDVVRGDDLLGSTARQLLLYRALNLPPPRFAHVPLILGPDGARLSKRHGSISIRSFRDRGRTPRQMIALLASTLNLCAADEQLTARDLIPRFSLDQLPRSPTTLQLDAL